MGIEFQGNGNSIGSNFFIRKDSNAGETQRTENVNVPMTDNKVVGEYGDKLLDQVQPRFIEAARISEADALDLRKMFEMAGVKNPKMPTVAQYASVSRHLATVTQAMDELITTNNVRDLYDSPEFNKLNDLFDIG